MLGIVVFIRGRWVHWGAPCVSSGSLGLVGFIRVRPGGRLVHPIGVVGFIRVRPGGRRVHSG